MDGREGSDDEEDETGEFYEENGDEEDDDEEDDDEDDDDDDEEDSDGGHEVASDAKPVNGEPVNEEEDANEDSFDEEDDDEEEEGDADEVGLSYLQKDNLEDDDDDVDFDADKALVNATNNTTADEEDDCDDDEVNDLYGGDVQAKLAVLNEDSNSRCTRKRKYEETGDDDSKTQWMFHFQYNLIVYWDFFFDQYVLLIKLRQLNNLKEYFCNEIVLLSLFY